VKCENWKCENWNENVKKIWKCEIENVKLEKSGNVKIGMEM
jgi:hypothetical protein